MPERFWPDEIKKLKEEYLMQDPPDWYSYQEALDYMMGITYLRTQSDMLLPDDDDERSR
jgi:hypothetical protein